MGQPRTQPTVEWTDAEMLTALDMRANGISGRLVGLRLGRSKGAVMGMFKRIADESGPPDHHDGTMPPGWWKAGLAKRERADA